MYRISDDHEMSMNKQFEPEPSMSILTKHDKTEELTYWSYFESVHPRVSSALDTYYGKTRHFKGSAYSRRLWDVSLYGVSSA